MDPRGRGSGRARGRGRGGGPQAPRGAANAAPLAAQLRQLDRLQEPEEMTILRRFKDLTASQVNSTYGLNGLLDRKVLLPAETLLRLGEPCDGKPTWVSLLKADNLLQTQRSLEERERALNRRVIRLPESRHLTAWRDLTSEERRILLLSQKDFNSFFRSQGERTAQQAQTTGASRPSTPSGERSRSRAASESRSRAGSQTRPSGQAGGAVIPPLPTGQQPSHASGASGGKGLQAQKR